MENVNNSLIQASMRYGVPLGMFWVFKYLFYMGSLKYPFLVTIYWGMSFVVPYLAYLLTKNTGTIWEVISVSSGHGSSGYLSTSLRH